MADTQESARLSKPEFEHKSWKPHPLRTGCSDCCRPELFQIAEIEAAWISRGIRQLPAAQRAALQAKAIPYLEARGASVTAKGEQEAWGSLPQPAPASPAPPLTTASVPYLAPPALICRKFGIPLYNPDKPGRVFACELNFKAGDEIDDGHLVQIQTAIHQEWKGVQAEYNRRGLPRDPKPITVARAILEDFSTFIEQSDRS